MENALSSQTSKINLERFEILWDILRRPQGAIGFAIVSIFIVTVIFAPIIAPYDYAHQDIPNRFQGPSVKYWLGTDHLGRDLFSRLVYGARIALGVA
ncbi:MAG: ABC transporter permease, partial [Anaerolineales bacterium]